MKIGVTGGLGFIGSNLVENLLLRNFEIVVIDDLSTGLKSNLNYSNVNFHELSITNLEACNYVLKDCEVIVHLAARGSVPRSLKNPTITHDVNVTGTLNMLEIARKNNLHFIYSSSSSVYGANDAIPKNEKMWLAPKTPYAASKLSAESYVQSYGYSYDVPVTNLRFFNVFGPKQRPNHQYAAVVPKWIWKAVNDQAIDVYGDGTQTRDFTFVGTVVDIIEQAISNRVLTKSAVNVAYGNNISLLEVSEQIKKYFPNLTYNFLESRVGDIKNSQNDPALIKELFPSVKPIDFSTGLEKTINWLKGENIDSNPLNLDLD
jgi:UDP-glucose 4-epimerase